MWGFESVCVMYQHEPSSKDRNSQARPTLDMELSAFYGDVSLTLPRASTFRGPITIRTGDNRIAFSPAFAERVVMLSEVSLWQASRHTLLAMIDRKVESGAMVAPATRLGIIYWITSPSMRGTRIHARESTWTAKGRCLLLDSTFGCLSVLVLRDIFHG